MTKDEVRKAGIEAGSWLAKLLGIVGAVLVTIFANGQINPPPTPAPIVVTPTPVVVPPPVVTPPPKVDPKPPEPAGDMIVKTGAAVQVINAGTVMDYKPSTVVLSRDLLKIVVLAGGAGPSPMPPPIPAPPAPKPEPPPIPEPPPDPPPPEKPVVKQKIMVILIYDSSVYNLKVTQVIVSKDLEKKLTDSGNQMNIYEKGDPGGFLAKAGLGEYANKAPWVVLMTLDSPHRVVFNGPMPLSVDGILEAVKKSGGL